MAPIMANVPPPEDRPPLEVGRCVSCGHPVPGRRPTCSAKCRVAQWRRTRERVHTATVAQLQGEVAQRQAEVAALRQHIAELQHLVGRLKARWARR
jgi:hypothetical protein